MNVVLFLSYCVILNDIYEKNVIIGYLLQFQTFSFLKVFLKYYQESILEKSNNNNIKDCKNYLRVH